MSRLEWPAVNRCWAFALAALALTGWLYWAATPASQGASFLPPACADVSATVEESGTVSLPLKCTGATNIGALTLSIESQPAVGTLTLPTGSTTASYSAPAQYAGLVTFTYSATSAGPVFKSNIATGTIEVTQLPPPQQPQVAGAPPACEGSLTRITDPSLTEIAEPAGEELFELDEGEGFTNIEDQESFRLGDLRKVATKFPEIFKPLSASVPLKCTSGQTPLNRRVTAPPRTGQLGSIENVSGTAKFNFEWRRIPDSEVKQYAKVFKDEPWPADLPKQDVGFTIYPTGYEDQFKFVGTDALNRTSSEQTARVRVFITPFCALYLPADPALTFPEFRCAGERANPADPKMPFFTAADTGRQTDCSASARLTTVPGGRPYAKWKKFGRGRHRLTVSSTYVRRGIGKLRLSHESRGESLKSNGADTEYDLKIDSYNVRTSRPSSSRASASIDTRAIKPGRHVVKLIGTRFTGKGKRAKFRSTTLARLPLQVSNCGAAKVRVRPGKRLRVNVYGGGPALKAARITLPAKIARAIKGKAKSAQGSKVAVTYKRGVLTLKALAGSLQRLNASLKLSARGAHASRKQRLTYTASVAGQTNTVKVSTSTKSRRH